MMNGEVAFSKRRKGANDTDVRASATSTELADQLSAIEATLSANQSPEVCLALKRQLEAIRERIVALMNTSAH
jgi:hypothetical protein